MCFSVYLTCVQFLLELELLASTELDMAFTNTVIKLLPFTLYSPPVTIVLDGLGFLKFGFENLFVLKGLYVLRFWMLFSACLPFLMTPT